MDKIEKNNVISMLYSIILISSKEEVLLSHL